MQNLYSQVILDYVFHAWRCNHRHTHIYEQFCKTAILTLDFVLSLVIITKILLLGYYYICMAMQSSAHA